MLPKTFRFVALNETGNDLHYNTGCRISVTYEPWKFDTNGAVSYGSEVTTSLNTFTTNSVLSNNASITGSLQDNSSNVYLGVNGVFNVTLPSGSATGTVGLYYEWSTDGGTTWPRDKPEASVSDDLESLTTIPFASASGQRASVFSID